MSPASVEPRRFSAASRSAYKRHKILAGGLLWACLIVFVIAHTAKGDVLKGLSACGYGGGGRFTSIAVHPENSRQLLIGSDVAGVFKSADGGRSFDLLGAALDGFAVADMAFHPLAPERAFLLTDSGLFGSRNSGNSWFPISDRLAYRFRFPGSHLMAFSKNHLWVATDRKGVFRISLEAPRGSQAAAPGLEGTQLSGLAIYGGHLYAAGVRGVYRYEKGKWRPCSQGLPPASRHVTNIVAHPAGRLYIVEKKTGLYVWDGEKESWAARGTGALKPRPKAYRALAVHPDNPDRILLGTHPESWPYQIFMSDSGGRSWERSRVFRPAADAPGNWAKALESIEEIAFSPGDPQQVFLTDWWNVWKSTDGGRRWAQLHRGLQNTCIHSVTSSPQDASRIYLSMADSGLMVSTNGGRTWQRKMAGVPDGHAQEAEVSRRNPAVIYLLMTPWTPNGKINVYRSDDGAETWRDVSFPVPARPLPSLDFVDGLPTNIEIDPASDDTVYVGTNGYGVFKTTSGGREWKAANIGLATPYIKGPQALRVHPGNPRTLYASTLSGGVYLSADAGGTWRKISPKYPFTFGLALDGSTPGRIIACCPEKTIILSEDDGRTWKEVRLPGPVNENMTANAVSFHPRNSRLVFVGTLAYSSRPADGLFFSRDGGRSFARYPSDLPRVSINSLHVPGTKEADVLVGFSGIGLYRGSVPSP